MLKYVEITTGYSLFWIYVLLEEYKLKYLLHVAIEIYICTTGKYLLHVAIEIYICTTGNYKYVQLVVVQIEISRNLKTDIGTIISGYSKHKGPILSG